jgi:hypothetical protein
MTEALGLEIELDSDGSRCGRLRQAMDPELIAYLDRQFASLREDNALQAATLREETAQQFASLREETAQQIASLREETAFQFASLREELTQQIASLREETTLRFERLERSIRQAHVLVEAVRSDLRLVAEGVFGANESMAALNREVSQKFSELRGYMGKLYTELDLRLRPLEVWKQVTDRDPIELIREKFGKPSKAQ